MGAAVELLEAGVGPEVLGATEELLFLVEVSAGDFVVVTIGAGVDGDTLLELLELLELSGSEDEVALLVFVDSVETPPGAGVTSPGAGVTLPGAGVTPPGAGVTPPGAGVTPPDAGITPPGAGVFASVLLLFSLVA